MDGGYMTYLEPYSYAYTKSYTVRIWQRVYDGGKMKVGIWNGHLVYNIDVAYSLFLKVRYKSFPSETCIFES